MTIGVLIYVIVYMGILVAYFFSETSGNFKRRVINKCILAAMFTALALYLSVTNRQFAQTSGIILMFGILFAALGDVLLLWDFTKGGASFSVGNIILFAAYYVYFGENGVPFSAVWWFLLLHLAFLAFWYYLMKSGWINFGKYGIKMILYLWSVMLHGTLSIAGLTQLQDPKSLLMFIGSILFMISDWFICLHKFKYTKSKAVHRLNSGTYFTGLILIALSCGF